MADAIDGDWCSATGAHLSIDGSALVTPGGSSITGNYSRHAFSYLVPLPEKNAGSTVIMSLLNEETMMLRRQAPGSTKFGPVETWHRCDVTS